MWQSGHAFSHLSLQKGHKDHKVSMFYDTSTNQPAPYAVSPAVVYWVGKGKVNKSIKEYAHVHDNRVLRSTWTS